LKRVGLKEIKERNQLISFLESVNVTPSRKFYEYVPFNERKISEGPYTLHRISARRVLRNDLTERSPSMEWIKKLLSKGCAYSSTQLTRSLRGDPKVVAEMLESYRQGHPYSLLGKHILEERTDRGILETVTPILFVPGNIREEPITLWQESERYEGFKN
jgi:hypothetical protein